MIDFLIFFVSLAVLVKSSETVIEKSIDIARILKISTFAVGFIILAIATSLPELMVSVIAAFQGNMSIAIGNVIGSNIADICLVLSITTFFGIVWVSRKWVVENSLILWIISLLPFALMNITQFTRRIGFLLLMLFFFYCTALIKPTKAYKGWEEPTLPHVLKTYVLFYVGIILIIVSAQYVVGSGTRIAELLGVPQSFIGLTLIAVGTSLPELAVNLSAIRKRQAGLALGNILGSCITNLTLVLGAAAVVNPLAINMSFFNTSSAFLVFASIFLYYILKKYSKIEKKHAVLLFLIYCVFLAVEVLKI